MDLLLASSQAKSLMRGLIVFILSDRSLTSIFNDWFRGQGLKRRFLRTITNSTCSYFSVVLAPWSDEGHHDHIHLDKGNCISYDG